MKDVQQAINAQMNDVAPDLNSDSLSERSSTIYRRQSKYNTVAINELLCLKNAGAQISMFFTSNK